MADYPECPKCSDIYGNKKDHAKAPKILDCGDSICKECLEKFIKEENEEFPCPKCGIKVKNEHNIDNYPTNKAVIKVVDESFYPKNSEEKDLIEYKIISLGNSSVGKTSIFLRLSKDIFNENHLATLGCDKSVYYINYKSKKYKLHLHDPAGQEQFKAVTRAFLRDPDGVLFIYDISNKKSFDDLESWFNIYKEENEKLVGLLIGNKCDKEREVGEKEAEKFAEKHGLKYLETSAKLDRKVKKAIACLLEEIIKSNPSEKKNKYCHIDNYSAQTQKKKEKKCC